MRFDERDSMCTRFTLLLCKLNKMHMRISSRLYAIVGQGRGIFLLRNMCRHKKEEGLCHCRFIVQPEVRSPLSCAAFPLGEIMLCRLLHHHHRGRCYQNFDVKMGFKFTLKVSRIPARTPGLSLFLGSWMMKVVLLAMLPASLFT